MIISKIRIGPNNINQRVANIKLKKKIIPTDVFNIENESECIPHFANPWTVAHQASLSLEFSKQEYWSG